MASHIIIIFAGFVGFSIANYIRHKKSANEVLACPAKADCETVIQSRFAKFFGVPVEVLGMAYYGFMALFYGLITLIPEISVTPVNFFIITVTTAAFLFSAYLTFIQALAIKNWCSWCLTSAALSTIIFIAAISSLPEGLIPFLEKTHEVITIIHIMSMAIGVGAATIANIFFFKFLRDLRISQFEADVLKTISEVMWLALGILVVSGIALYLPNSVELLEAPEFLVKVIIVAVIIANGALLNLIVSPKLIHISFSEKHEHEEGELHRLKKFALTLGAISIISWYSTLLLGIVSSITFSFVQIFGIYIGLLVVGVIVSQIIERRI